MDRREAFEKDWSQRYSMTAEEVRAHRFADQDGYDLPLLAAHYRTFCSAIESVVVELPQPKTVCNPEIIRLVGRYIIKQGLKVSL